jgi:3-hydroxyacyl-[acyl-carrier-protein] dehydratase
MKFRLIDRILSWTPHRQISGVKAVSFEEYSLKEAFGEPPGLPGLLVLESILQLGNWLILLSSDYQQMGMVAKLARVEFHDRVRPGQQLRLEVNYLGRRADGFLLAGEGRAGGRTVITGLECLAFAVPAADYVDAEQLRTLYSEIYRPET